MITFQIEYHLDECKITVLVAKAIDLLNCLKIFQHTTRIPSGFKGEVVTWRYVGQEFIHTMHAMALQL